MFKRVDKRRRKKEEEEELGIDEDMKEILGIHDTDSEESDSDSDESSPPSGEDEEGPEADFSASEDGYLSVDEENAEPILITVQEALRDPVYLISIQPEVNGCVACPGKVLKGTQMLALHRQSNAHDRRFKQFKTLTATARPTDNAWDIIRRSQEEKIKPSLAPSETSRRAEKRRARAAAQKARRDKQRLKAKSRKAPALDTNAPGADYLPKKKQKKNLSDVMPTPLVIESPPKKKRKSGAPTTESPPSTKPEGSETATKITVGNIVRSTSARAKQARTRFLKTSNKSAATPSQGGTV